MLNLQVDFHVLQVDYPNFIFIFAAYFLSSNQLLTNKYQTTMKKRILILMMLLTAIVTGAWAKDKMYDDCDHIPGDPVPENVIDATCTEAGGYDNVTYCTQCGEELSRDHITWDPLGHNWGSATYTWADDYTQATASRTCQRDASHVDSETVQTTSVVTMEPTATEPGEITYTATFTKPGFTTQTKVLTLRDNEYEVTCDYFVWYGTTYTASGEYTYVTGTDVYKLNLTIHYSTSEIWEREVYIGQHFEEYPFEFDVTADTPLTQTGTNTNADGCDNVITLNLTIINLDEYYYDGVLGFIYTPERTVFKLWDPTATSVKLNRYATGTDSEAGAQSYGSIEMSKLMDGSNWTGVWTCSLDGDIKGSYYTYSVNGTEIADPWSQAVGFDGKRSMVFDNWDATPSGWDSDIHVFYEPGNTMEYIDVATFSADPMCGVSEGYRGKYLALTETGTTYGNAGEELTCMSKLQDEGCKAVIVTMTDPQTMPDQYSTNPYNGTTVINEVQQAIMAVHNTFGMSFFVRFDFTTIPVNDVLRQRYIWETCLYWVNEYHTDGIVLAADIDTETKDLIRDILDGIDPRVVLATDDEIAALQIPDGISTIHNAQVSRHNYYTLDGRKLQAIPTVKGIYIVNGKKVVIK